MQRNQAKDGRCPERDRIAKRAQPGKSRTVDGRVIGRTRTSREASEGAEGRKWAGWLRVRRTNTSDQHALAKVTPRSQNRRPVRCNRARVRHRLCCGNSIAQLMRASSDGEPRFAHLRASGTEDFPRNLSCRQPPDWLAIDLWSRTADYGVYIQMIISVQQNRRGGKVQLCHQ